LQERCASGVSLLLLHGLGSHFRRVARGQSGQMKLLKHTLAVLVTVSLFQATVLAQPTSPIGDWKTVSTRKPGDVLAVQMGSGKKVKGPLKGASESALLLEQKGKGLEIQRADVASVAIVGARKSATRPALIGAGIGAGAGAAIGAAATRPKQGDIINVQAVGAVVFGTIGFVGGGVVGYLTGRNRNKETRIYEAPPLSSPK
jgi:hypothetical protein